MTSRINSFIASIICGSPFKYIIDWLYKDEVSFKGESIGVRYPEVTAEVKARLVWGIYESAEVRAIEKYLDPNTDVIELGGGIGAVSCVILNKIKEEKKLTILEANQNLVQIIKENVDNNYPTYNVRIISKAVVGEKRVRKVVFDVEDNYRKGKISKEDKSGTNTVQCLSFGEIIEDRRKSYTLVADIEGSEVGIIENGRDYLKQCSSLIIELHSTTYNGNTVRICDMVKKIRELDFELLEKDGNVFVFKK